MFYHRQTGRDESSRQATLEPIDAAIGKDGKIYLGRVEYRGGEPVSSAPAQMTSQGPQVNGLNAREWISAGYACHLHGGKEAAWIAPVYVYPGSFETEALADGAVRVLSGQEECRQYSGYPVFEGFSPDFLPQK